MVKSQSGVKPPHSKESAARGGFGLLEGVVGRADEGAGFDVFEAHGFA
jgi:hypothetical protein